MLLGLWRLPAARRSFLWMTSSDCVGSGAKRDQVFPGVCFCPPGTSLRGNCPVGGVRWGSGSWPVRATRPQRLACNQNAMRQALLDWLLPLGHAQGSAEPPAVLPFPENTKLARPSRHSDPNSPHPSVAPCPARAARGGNCFGRWKCDPDPIACRASHGHAKPFAQADRSQRSMPVACPRMDHFPLSAAKTSAHERPWPLRAARWITKPSTTAAPPSAAEKAKRLPRIPRVQADQEGPFRKPTTPVSQKPCLLSSLEHRPAAAIPHRRRRWRSPHSFTPNVRSLLLHHALPVPRTTALTTVCDPLFDLCWYKSTASRQFRRLRERDTNIHTQHGAVNAVNKPSAVAGRPAGHERRPSRRIRTILQGQHTRYARLTETATAPAHGQGWGRKSSGD